MVNDIFDAELTDKEIKDFKAKFTRFSHLPLLDSLLSYLTMGYKKWFLGDFEKALLSNNLIRSFSTADHRNRILIYEYCNLLYNHFPSNSWGSLDKKNWTDKDGKAYVKYILEQNTK